MRATTKGKVRQQLEEKLAGLPFVTRRPSRYPHGSAFFVGKREIAHFHSDGALDVRLTKALIVRQASRLKGIIHATERRQLGKSNWLVLDVDKAGPEEIANLVLRAVEANSKEHP